MNETSFKQTLAKALEKEYIKGKKDIFNNTYKEDFIDVYSNIPMCELYFEYTNIFTGFEWDTYKTILNIQVLLNKVDVFEKYKKEILSIAASIFGRQDDHFLTDLNIGIKPEKYQTFDFSELGLNETLRNAINDAQLLMAQGKYSSSIDRVHTAIHGYLRIRLDELSIEYSDEYSIPKLFNLLYKQWEEIDNNQINDMMLKSLRSASSILDTLNTIRNKYSLAHPNEELIREEEAKFILGLVENIMNYIEVRVIAGEDFI